MTTDEFVNKYNGVHIDEDGYYGAQCWDLVARYAREAVGCPSFPTSSGGAEGLYRVFADPIPAYFDRIANDPNDPNQVPSPGDIIVWSSNFYPPWGHTALCISADPKGITVLEQDGSNPGGSSYIKTRNYNNVAGWLRAKQSATTLAPNQRVVGPAGANYRTAPDSGASLISEFVGGDVLDFKGFVHGQDPYGNGNDVWFVGLYSGGYIYSGACTDSSTNGLNDITPAPPTPVPPVVTPPTYNFVKDLACVTEVIPAGTNNFEYGDFPAKPAKAVIHDFGTLGTDTYQSVINTIKNNGSRVVSAHFVVSGKKITQMVSLSDRAYHAGPNGNGFVGIETDPAQDPDTIASARTLLKELKAKYGYQLPLVKHSEIMSTACGDDVDLANYDITEKPVEPPKPTEPPITPVEPPKPVEPPVNGSQTLLDVIKQLISKIIDFLGSWKRS